MTVVLECTGLDGGYVPGRPCVREITLSLSSGEVLALLGANGAGKTTLLTTIAGLRGSLCGRVSVDGTDLRPGNARQASRSGVVLVPDDRALFTTLTVEENLKLATRRTGPTVSDALGYFPALAERLKVRAGMLSGGEQQMLTIARALVQSPKVLLIDELSMGLAPVIVSTLLPVIRTVADRTGVAVILVEQHVRPALQIADRAVVLTRGRQVLDTPAAELLAAPERIEQAYLGGR